MFPQTAIQRCIIHQIPNSLKYVSWKDKKAFVADLKKDIVYRQKLGTVKRMALAGER